MYECLVKLEAKRQVALIMDEIVTGPYTGIGRQGSPARKVDSRLPGKGDSNRLLGKGNSNSRSSRPVY